MTSQATTRSSKLICVGHEKGGVGKSTIATNLLVAFNQQQPGSAALVDTDTTGSSTQWGMLRTQLLVEPPVTVVSAPKNAVATIKDLATRYQVLIVDIGARDYELITPIAAIADFWLAPFQLGRPDLQSTINLANAIRNFNSRHFNGEIPLHAFFNRVRSQGAADVAAARNLIAEEAPGLKLLDTVVHDRKAWVDSGNYGKSVLEMPQSSAGKATDEFVSLFTEVVTVMNGGQKRRAKR